MQLFPGFDVVISAINAHALPDQHKLVEAAHKAKVGRFVPCFFGTAAPPRGVMRLREMVSNPTHIPPQDNAILTRIVKQKEDVLDHIRKLYLPYTAIDVGWWYQISPPRVPSGRMDSGLLFPAQHILGDGTVPSAMTDLADVGRYVAKIVADPRTLNKMVFAYSELLTQKQVWDTVEKVSGEKLERKYVSLLTSDSNWVNLADISLSALNPSWTPSSIMPRTSSTRARQTALSSRVSGPWSTRTRGASGAITPPRTPGTWGTSWARTSTRTWSTSRSSASLRTYWKARLRSSKVAVVRAVV